MQHAVLQHELHGGRGAGGAGLRPVEVERKGVVWAAGHQVVQVAVLAAHSAATVGFVRRGGVQAQGRRKTPPVGTSAQPGRQAGRSWAVESSAARRSVPVCQQAPVVPHHRELGRAAQAQQAGKGPGLLQRFVHILRRGDESRERDRSEGVCRDAGESGQSEESTVTRQWPQGHAIVLRLLAWGRSARSRELYSIVLPPLALASGSSRSRPAGHSEAGRQIHMIRHCSHS